LTLILTRRYLYDLKVDTDLDTVASYFGLRTFELEGKANAVS
jgi:hypothetical protein